jgi:hypothetical protein
LLETLERWRKTLPDLLKNTLQASVQKFEVMKSRGENIPPTESPLTKYFPLRIIYQSTLRIYKFWNPNQKGRAIRFCPCFLTVPSSILEPIIFQAHRGFSDGMQPGRISYKGIWPLSQASCTPPFDQHPSQATPVTSDSQYSPENRDVLHAQDGASSFLMPLRFPFLANF